MGCGLCSAIQSRMYALVPSSFFGPPQGLTPININPGFLLPSHKLCRHRNNIHKANLPSDHPHASLHHSLLYCGLILCWGILHTIVSRQQRDKMYLC